ncbi:MAG: orotidine-5'-phosphate decarboxylase [Aureliella sp.]
MNFGARLAEQVQQKNSAVCVGLDPRWSSLPDAIKSGVEESDLCAVASATTQYCCEVVDAVADVSPIIKPQAAFFELLGPAGMQSLADTIAHCRAKGMLVLLDGKRGDIGSTAQGYAEAYLGQGSPWSCDALTVNPYLGNDTLEPFVQRATDTDSGIFVLVKTSNPGSGFIQDLTVDDASISSRVANVVQDHASRASSTYGDVGAVVGATYPEQLAEMRQRMPSVWLLIPGFGAQGGTAEDVKAGFDDNAQGAIVNSSRGIIFAYQQDQYQELDWQDAVHRAAATMAQQLPQAK